MSPVRRDDAGIPRQTASLGGSAAPEEDWSGANSAKAAKLRQHSLQRQARACGIELRHSSYGYALIDTARKPVHDRRDLTLDEVEAWLERGRSGEAQA